MDIRTVGPIVPILDLGPKRHLKGKKGPVACSMQRQGGEREWEVRGGKFKKIKEKLQKNLLGLKSATSGLPHLERTRTRNKSLGNRFKSQAWQLFAFYLKFSFQKENSHARLRAKREEREGLGSAPPLP